jgi:hypothetical protein
VVVIMNAILHRIISIDQLNAPRAQGNEERRGAETSLKFEKRMAVIRFADFR